MIVILCTIDPDQYNDSAIPGLVYSGLRANLNDKNHVYAAYQPDQHQLEITEYDYTQKTIQLPQDGRHSMRYVYVSYLLSNMHSGDWLMAVSLADLADTAAEAEQLYFSFLAKQIQMTFYDAPYLNTETLQLKSDPSEDQKQLVARIIQSYYKNGNRSDISKHDREQMSAMHNGEKKSAS